MYEELANDMVLFAKYLRRLAVKYPDVYITAYTRYDSTAVDVTYNDYEPKEDGNCHFSGCVIEESGKIELTKW